MKNKKTAEVYLTQKENPILDAILMGMLVLGLLLVALWLLFNMGFGFLGIPVSVISGVGITFLRSSKVSDEDFDSDVKRIIKANNIEKTESTLKEYIAGMSEHIKQGKDKKIRTAYYCVTVFSFKNDICTIKKHIIDLFEETVSVSEYSVPVGSKCDIIEKSYQTVLGNIDRNFLKIDNNFEIMIPVNINVYDTEAVMKRLTHKR